MHRSGESRWKESHFDNVILVWFGRLIIIVVINLNFERNGVMLRSCLSVGSVASSPFFCLWISLVSLFRCVKNECLFFLCESAKYLCFVCVCGYVCANQFRIVFRPRKIPKLCMRFNLIGSTTYNFSHTPHTKFEFSILETTKGKTICKSMW